MLTVPTPVDAFAQPVGEGRLADLRAALGLAPDAPVLLWVGFPAAFKHIELLLAAYRQVRAARPAARLVLAGDFQTRPDFVRQAGAEGVIFAGGWITAIAGLLSACQHLRIARATRAWPAC